MGLSTSAKRKFKTTDCPVEHRWKATFSAELARLRELNVYINPLTRQMVTRQPLRRKPKPLPQGAIFVGCYRSPFPLSDFVADMHATMALIPSCPA